MAGIGPGGKSESGIAPGLTGIRIGTLRPHWRVRAALSCINLHSHSTPGSTGTHKQRAFAVGAGTASASASASVRGCSPARASRRPPSRTEESTGTIGCLSGWGRETARSSAKAKERARAASTLAVSRGCFPLQSHFCLDSHGSKTEIASGMHGHSSARWLRKRVELTCTTDKPMF